MDWDSPELRNLLKPGGLYLDLGANLGWATRIFASTGGVVYAFEPNPHAFAMLRQDFQDTPGVRCINKAVAAFAGTARLYLHEDHDQDPVQFASGSSLLPDKINVADRYLEVEVVRASETVREITMAHGRKIDLLKIDVEGVEFDILEDLLLSGRLDEINTVLVETHEEKIPSIRERSLAVRRLLEQAGRHHVVFDWK